MVLKLKNLFAAELTGADGSTEVQPRAFVAGRTSRPCGGDEVPVRLIRQQLDGIYRRHDAPEVTLSDRIDRHLTHRFTGFVFLAY